MKNKIFFLILFSGSIFCNGQENIQLNNFFSFDIGATHSTYFKQKYHPKGKPVIYDLSQYKLETDYPGYSDIPVTSYEIGVKYTDVSIRKSRFFNSIGLYCSNRIKITERRKDSIELYNMFSDSIKQFMSFEFANAPFYTKNSPFRVELRFDAGYKYKNLSLEFGIIFNIHTYERSIKKYINGVVVNKKGPPSPENTEILFQFLIRYQILHKGLPMSIYVGADRFYKLGCEFSIASLKTGQK